MKITYEKLVAEIHPSLTTLKKLALPVASIDELINIGKNVSNSEKYFLEFQGARDALMLAHCDKDKDGKPIIERVDGEPNYKFEDPTLMNQKMKELLEKKVEMTFHKIRKEIFVNKEGKIIDGVTVETIMGLQHIFEK